MRSTLRTAALAALGLLAGTGLVVPVSAASPPRSGSSASASASTSAVAAASVIAVRSDSASDRKRDLDQQLDNLREELEGTSKKLVDAALDLRRAQSQLVDANTDLDTAHSALAAATALDQALAGRLAMAEAGVDKARRDLDARQEQESNTRGRLGGLAREAYVSSGLSGLSIALNAESPEQFADRVNVAGTALREQNGTLDRLEVQQSETRARQSRLMAARNAVVALKDQSEAVVEERTTAQEQAAAATARIAKLVAVQKGAVATIAARKSGERKRLAALSAQEKKLSILLKKRARAQAAAARRSKHARIGPVGGTGSTNGSGRLSYPVSAPITSGFGWRYHPILHYYRLHAGTDFGAPCGTPVHAAAPGRIVRAGRAGGFGNQVVIDHGRIRGKSLATSYNHLSRFVKRSGTVRRGQVIAYSGTTGLSTGCHLHFEVYVNGVHVNPMNWL